MFKKGRVGFLAGAVVLLFLLPVFFGCKNDVDESSEDVDFDVTVVNPFIGVWKETDEKFWQFNTNGTGGTAATAEGPFRNDFSFLVHTKLDGDDVWLGKTSLVLLSDELGTTPSINVTRYTFSIEGNEATLTPVVGEDDDITLTQVSGSPQYLRLTNPLIGEWTTKWSLNGTDWAPGTQIWSLKYRTDGTVRTYHHSAGHQFENSYALRGNTLVIYGQRRFAGAAGTSIPSPTFVAIKADITYLGNDSWRVQEWESWGPAQNSANISWIYTKVNTAKWKEE